MTQQHEPPTSQALVAVIRFATIKQAAELRPEHTEAGWRDLRFKAADRTNSRGERIPGNGTAAAGVWVQIGRKIIVDLAAYDRYMESKKQVAA